jgi:hypothetical protein
LAQSKQEGDIHACSPDPIGDAQDKLIAELAAQPEKFVADMPVMPKYDRNAERRKKNHEKMQDCKHVWLTAADQPLYKCNECGTFLRIEK